MLTKKQNIELGRFALDIESHDEQFKYMLLNRRLKNDKNF